MQTGCLHPWRHPQRSWTWPWATRSKFEARSNFEVRSLHQRPPEPLNNLNYSVIHGSKSKAQWCLWGRLYFSSTKWGDSHGLCFGRRNPAWVLPSNLPLRNLPDDAPSAFANKTWFSDDFQPRGTQSCRQFVQALRSLLWLGLLKSRECLVVVQKHAWKEIFARSNPEAPDSAKPLNMCLRLAEFFGEEQRFPGLWKAT